MKILKIKYFNMYSCFIPYLGTYIDVGMFLIALIGVVFGLVKYVSNNKMKALEQELENLRLFFSSIESNGNKYKKEKINYPRNMAYNYGVSLFNFKIVRQVSYYSINTRMSVYDNFYQYILSCKNYIKTSELTLSQMIELYNIYVENLQQRYLLDQTFQVLYTCVHGILEGYVSTRKSKQERLQRVQNSITSTQAILYFFNQLQFADRQRKKNRFMEELRENNFFKEMFNSQEYKNIQFLIPLSVEKLFYKQEK